VRVLSNQDGNDQVRDKHDQATPKEQRTTADTVHGPERAEHTNELQAVEHAGHDELHVVIESHFLKNCRRIVDQSVDSHELGKTLARSSMEKRMQ
jgi:hypothetical protein